MPLTTFPDSLDTFVTNIANQDYVLAADINLLQEVLAEAEKLLIGRMWVNVKSKGAVGDGVTDDTAAFTSAKAELVNSGGGELYVPKGTFRIVTGFSTDETIKWKFHPQAILSIDSGQTVTISQPMSDAPLSKHFAGSGKVIWGRRVSEIFPEWWGALSDTQRLADAVMTAGSAVLQSATGAFVLSDVGKKIVVWGGATGSAGLFTTIASYQSATQVTLSSAPIRDLSNVPFAWGTSGNRTAFTNLMASLNVSTLAPKIKLGSGKYGIDADNSSTTNRIYSNCHFEGAGLERTEVVNLTFGHLFLQPKTVPDPNNPGGPEIPVAPIENVSWSGMTMCVIGGIVSAPQTVRIAGESTNTNIRVEKCRFISDVQTMQITQPYGCWVEKCWLSPLTNGICQINFNRNQTDTSVESGNGVFIRDNLFDIMCAGRTDALGNARTVTDGAITIGTAILTSATAAFVAADAGRRIEIANAGNAAGTQYLQANISTVDSPTQVTISTNALATVSGQTLKIGDLSTNLIGQAVINLVVGYAEISNNQIRGFPTMGILLEGNAKNIHVHHNTVAATAGWPTSSSSVGSIFGIFCKGNRAHHINNNILIGTADSQAGIPGTRSIGIGLVPGGGATGTRGDLFDIHDNAIELFYELFRFGDGTSTYTVGSWKFHHNHLRNPGLNFVTVLTTAPTATGCIGHIENNDFEMSSTSSAVSCSLNLGAGSTTYFRWNHFKNVTGTCVTPVNAEATATLIVGWNESDQGSDIFDTSNTASTGLDAPFAGEFIAEDALEVRSGVINLDSGSPYEEVLAQINSRNNYLFLGLTLMYVTEASSADAGVVVTVAAVEDGASTTLHAPTTEVSKAQYYAKDYFIKDNLSSVDIPPTRTCIKVTCPCNKTGAGEVRVFARYMRN